MKQTIEKVMLAGAKGVKITLAGRLNGVEIARRETLSKGKIPLITIRSHVEYAGNTARTLYGAIGIKVWVYKGESFEMIDKLVDKKEDIKRKPKK